MAKVTIYHNPRCSKSRQTLEMIRSRGIEPEIVLYLEDPPDARTLKALLKKLGMKPWDLLRRKEAIFKELKLAEKQDNPAALIRAMAQHPVLIERPIVVRGAQAALGRPPENVLGVL